MRMKKPELPTSADTAVRPFMDIEDNVCELSEVLYNLCTKQMKQAAKTRKRDDIFALTELFNAYAASLRATGNLHTIIEDLLEGTDYNAAKEGLETLEK